MRQHVGGLFSRFGNERGMEGQRRESQGRERGENGESERREKKGASRRKRGKRCHIERDKQREGGRGTWRGGSVGGEMQVGAVSKET
jgi:hypothetical protein